MKMNIKTLAVITIVLIIGVIALQIFLPKKVDTATGRISTFKEKGEKDETTEVASEETI